MLAFFAECVPQLFVVLVAGSSAFGSSIIRNGAQQVGDFIEDGGGDGDAARTSSAALATAVLAMTSFVTTLCVVLLDTGFALSQESPFRYVFLIVLVLSVIALLIFFGLIANRQPYEMALDKTTKIFGWNAGERFGDKTPAQIVERATMLLMLASLVVGACKVLAPPEAGTAPATVAYQVIGPYHDPALHRSNLEALTSALLDEPSPNVRFREGWS